MKRYRPYSSRTLQLLLLAAFCYRALIPPGYMPVLSEAPMPDMPGMHSSGWLMICPGGLMGHDDHGALIERQCYFGMASAPTMPASALAPPEILPAVIAESTAVSVAQNATQLALRPPVRGPPENS